MLAPNFPDNNYKEIVNKIKKQLENEEDSHKRLKLMEQLSMPNLFSFNNGCYTKYKNPW
jgi:hypothetical protein